MDYLRRDLALVETFPACSFFAPKTHCPPVFPARDVRTLRSLFDNAVKMQPSLGVPGCHFGSK